MSLNFLGITDAIATQAQPATGSGGGLGAFLPMILMFFVISYFLIIRPQSKRAKAQRKLLSELAKGDEVITIGGIMGRISKISDDFISLEIAQNVEINVQKTAVANILPKGTLKSV